MSSPFALRPRLQFPGLDRIRHSQIVRDIVGGAVRFADMAMWRTGCRVDIFHGFDVDEWRAKYGKEEGEARFALEARPSGLAVARWNVLSTAGANLLLTALTSATNSTPFNTANAALGVGDSSTAAVASQTNLIAGTNAYRQVMDATYPIIATNQATFRISVGTSNANFAWQEFGAFSGVGTGSPPTGGTMLNRAVSSLGTKSNSASWVFTMTFSLA